MLDSPENSQPPKTVMLRHGNRLDKNFPVQSLVAGIKNGDLKASDKISTDGEKWLRLDKHPQLAKHILQPDAPPSKQSPKPIGKEPVDKPGEITLLSQKLKKGEINQEEFNLLSREVLEKPSLPKPMKIGSVNLGSKQILGISGSAILFFGVFTPIIQIPFYGYQNFFQNGKGGGVLIILFSFLALYGTLTGVNALLKTASLGAFCILGFTFINFHLKMADAKSDLDAQLTGSPFAGFAEVALQSVQLSWGWAVLILGAGLLLAAAMIKDTANADE